MRLPCFLILACFIGFFSIHCLAQPICGFDPIHAHQMKINPQYHQNVIRGESFIHKYIQQHPELLRSRSSRKIVTGTGPAQTLTGPYYIPIVVHVIHTGGDIGTIYNPTDDQILGAIDYLNAVYNGTWPGTTGAGDLGIQFVLARRDPNCNPTDGIVRIDGSSVAGYASKGVNVSTSLGADELDVKNLSRWDPTQYYNIWIVDKIDGNDGTSGQFVAGYAYLPGAPSTLDGIVMLATQMMAGQKTLPHEIGHAFDLYHPFQGSNNSSQCPLNTDCTAQGDSVCDTDPISYNINSGTGIIDFTCRTGTNPCTGTAYTSATESNYMNYTLCFTEFTLGQSARMQASAISPFRSSLTTSLGGTAPSGGSCSIPKIDFDLSSDRVTATTTSTSGCRAYTDYSYNMDIGLAPSATATATLAVNSGGTAIQGLDFDVTTNGNFTTSSQQLTFTSGSTTSQPFTVRVYNNPTTAGTKQFTLGFTVNNGGGNAVAGDGRSTFTMTIDNNGSTPTAGVTPTGTITLGTGIGSSSQTPFDATQASQRSQFLYMASELTAAGIPAGSISGLSIDFTAKNSLRAYTNLYIKLGTSTSSYLVSGGIVTLGSGMTTVKSLASYTTHAGWNTFTFDSPFTWDGTSNVVVEICYDNGTAAPSDHADNIEFYSDGGTSSQGNIFWQNSLNCWENFSTLTGAYSNGDKPMIQFTYGITPTTVQTVLNSSQSQALGPNADVYFYDQTNNQLMARIQNLTGFDYGCTQVVIDRAGTGASQFWNSTTANYLLDKTFHVLPTTNNPSGSYNITLYYTQAEINGWQTATGQSLSSIQLVKVPGQISQVTASNPGGGGAVTIGTPTISSLGSNTGLTYNFANGFSGFGAGVPGSSPLPITLLDFTGHLENNDAILTWSTSSEENSKTFEVDRSFDGIGFTPIGSVAAAGNSTTQRNYSFTDAGITHDTNYYRLRSIDLDDRFIFSRTVLVRDRQPATSFPVAPNPFTDGIDILFSQPPAGNIAIRLLDITGRQLWQGTGMPSGGNRLHIGFSGTPLSAGVYLLQITSGSGTQFQKIMKK